VAGNIVKLGTTSGNDVRIEGGTATNSGYVNFMTGETSRGYIGNASATDVNVVAQNGARLNFYTGGTNRIMINTAGQTDFYGNVAVNNGVGGTLTKFGSTAGYHGTFTGGTADNSPFLEFWANGSRRCYMGNANTTEVQFASENGAQFNFLTGGTSRLTISTNGTATFANNLTTNGNFAANASIANINGGSNFAVLNGYMAAGSLTIGDSTKNYGGGTSTWNTNTAGLMMECLTNTEIAVHDGGDRVASMMYYSGNTITLGRDMGWGVANTTIPSGAVFTQKGGNSGANFFNIQGNDLGSSPYLGFYFNNTRRCYMGNTTATNVDIIAENGAQLSLGTGGVSRMTINTTGDVVASNNLSANCLVINGGGTYQAGCIYSDAAWGMLFRAKVPGTNANFAWLDSAGTERMRIDSAGDTSTTGKITVQDVIRFGNYSGGNYDNIQFMRGTGSGQFPNIRCQNNYIGMYSSSAGGWISGSAVGDMTFLAESGRNIRLSVGGSPALVVDSSNNVLISQRELRVSQMNGHGQIRLKSGSTNISTIFHCNGTELYFLCTNNDDWEGGYNGLRPLKYSLTSGLVTMDNGLTVNNTITVASGDNSMTNYGPNGTWGAYLTVGSGIDKSNGNTAQVISTNGNLHLDGGNSLDMYYGYYTWARSTPNVHRFYGSVYIDSLMSIGTSVMRFPLYITSGRAWTWYLGAYLHSGGAHMHNQTNTWQVSIWTDSAIVTTHWFGTVSDQRIKKNIQPVGAMLETINRIEIVSFDFIDEPNNKRDECGIIAQQLETVFPNAVDTSTGVIPCYLKFATSQYLVNGDVYILFDYDHNDVQQQFKVGDNIKIHAGQNTADKGSHHVVVKSIIDGGFTTAPWKDYEENDGVFLHGKEVDDFRNVDKEQLGILALKGVQELSSSVVALEAANAAASSQMATLQQENAQLKSQVESLSSSHAALLQSQASLVAWAHAQGYSS
jgi:hypothetical protein